MASTHHGAATGAATGAPGFRRGKGAQGRREPTVKGAQRVASRDPFPRPRVQSRVLRASRVFESLGRLLRVRVACGLRVVSSEERAHITGKQGTHVGGQHEPRPQPLGGHAHRQQQSRRPPCGGGAAPRDWGVCVLAPLPARHCRQRAARGSLNRRGSQSTVDCVAGGAATRACPCGTPLLREVRDARPGVDRAAGGRTGVSATIVPYAA